jgi:uncharacterized lipoprotein YmbA
MRNRCGIPWWPCALSVLACACASTPQPRYYVLEATATPAAGATRLSILVEPVSIPEAVDRPQFVVSTQANVVVIEDLHRWAASLQDNVATVLSEDLAAQLGTPLVTTSQDIDEVPAYRVNVSVREFRSRLGEDAQLGASWNVRRKDGATRSGYEDVREPARGGDFTALAAAHSRAVARLSAQIAAAIRALDTSP